MRKLLPLTVAAGIVTWFFARHPRGKVLFGKVHGKISGLVPKEYDDATLKDKVESELFRDEHEVKGAININAQEGVVQLRGQLPSQDLIDALVNRTRYAIDRIRRELDYVPRVSIPAGLAELVARR